MPQEADTRMTTYTAPLTGTYVADPVHSSIGFAVKYMGGATYRGTFEQVAATLEAAPHGISLSGAAEVESISIRSPEPFRAHGSWAPPVSDPTGKQRSNLALE